MGEKKGHSLAAVRGTKADVDACFPDGFIIAMKGIFNLKNQFVQHLDMSSRRDFLTRSFLFASTAGLMAAAGCAGTSLTPKTSPTDTSSQLYSRRAKFKCRGTSSNIREVRSFNQAPDGEISANSDGTSYKGSSGDATFEANVASSDGVNNNITVAITQGGATTNLGVATPNAVSTYGTPQTANYWNGATLTRTIADDNNASGTLSSPDGRSWSVNVALTDSSMTFNYSGYSNGTLTVDISNFTVQSNARTTTCSKTTKEGSARVGSAFDVASLFLLGIGLVPASVVCGVIGAGLGVYSTFCRAPR